MLNYMKTHARFVAVVLVLTFLLSGAGCLSVYAASNGAGRRSFLSELIERRNTNSASIMVYEGKAVDMADFRFSVMASVGAEDEDAAVVKARALELLLDFLTLEKRARDEGIVIPADEKAGMLSVIQSMKAVHAQRGTDLSFIRDERMIEFMQRDVLYSLLSEKHTDSYKVDEEAFKKELADFMENQKAAYYNIELVYYTEANEANLIGLSEIYTQLSESAVNEILGLDVGERTEPVEIDSVANIVFEVKQYTIPSDAEVEKMFRDYYVSYEKDEMFKEILNGWIAEADYTLNQKAYDSFEL